MSLYRSFFEAHGWSPERLNALTPRQLLGIAGGAGRRGAGGGKTFRSTNEAIAELEARRKAEAAAEGGVAC